jgi:hypothetical protein
MTGRRFLSLHTLYARYYCVPTLQEELFEQVLREVLDAPDDIFPEVRLINRVARQRALLLLEMREDLF